MMDNARSKYRVMKKRTKTKNKGEQNKIYISHYHNFAWTKMESLLSYRTDWVHVNRVNTYLLFNSRVFRQTALI